MLVARKGVIYKMSMSKDIKGEYYLQGVREMASGFLLKPDNSFQFFFSYGALDRQASGNWKQEGDSIVFNSGKWSGADFTIITSEPGDEKEGVLIQLEKSNPMLAAYLYASLNEGAQDSWINFDQRGYIRLQPQPFTSINILFEFCPERFTKLSAKPGHHVYTIRPEPTLAEIYLNNFSLQLTPEGLKGKHPLMQGEEFLYEKNN